ncbi:hypothetical protein M878_44685 [Streptomyces roseochromogenus subsp. oscitans DS 12.976]|uniref:Uncharacterized protein n=1 Tax=Streptomyces roseochromogenus subsp. oscitans DS 12.976 TaxID=1352936 RepID=V6JES8_STRRC|nr:hypothetical protein M878_44685 [Streptomyces roseochromogenus subsp. oscitans DS 12.976]
MFDLPTPQMTTVAAGVVRLVATQMVRPRRRVPACRAGNADPVQDRDHMRGVAPLAGRDQQSQRPQPAFTSQVDLCAQPAA